MESLVGQIGELLLEAARLMEKNRRKAAGTKSEGV
jgi:hypothetical protein